LPLAIHCSVPEKFWLALLDAIGRMDIAADERFNTRDARRQNYPCLEEILAPTFQTKSREEWLRCLEARDVPAVPLHDVAEALADPQVRHLQLIEQVEHPVVGKLEFVGSPVRYSNFTESPPLPPPLVGEHTIAVLRELGYSDQTIEELRAEQVVGIAAHAPRGVP
jgi:crotonobetainyl-CoA:carnitine CoA-transferase CaiB-like acyl-CoA transferase